jgi:hypothetical protein
MSTYLMFEKKKEKFSKYIVNKTMNRFLSPGNSDSNPVTYQPSYNDSADDPASDPADPADDVDVVVDDRVNQNTIILQNQSSVPNLTSFLGDVYTSGIIRTSGIEVTGDIIINGKILSTSSSDTTDTSLLQEQINGLQTQVDEFISNDEVNELRELVRILICVNKLNKTIEINGTTS